MSIKQAMCFHIISGVHELYSLISLLSPLYFKKLKRVACFQNFFYSNNDENQYKNLTATIVSRFYGIYFKLRIDHL